MTDPSPDERHTALVERLANAAYLVHALPRWQAGWEHEDVEVCRDYEAIARACLAEIARAGMVVVPKEPTTEMIEAVYYRYFQEEAHTLDAYYRFLAAAPKP